MRTTQLRQITRDVLDDMKGQDIVTLDVRKVAIFTDYMIIVTGTSNRHVMSMADKIVEQLRERGRRPVGREGMESGDWVLIDYGDVVVHLMRAQTRDFYNLEKLWDEGKRIEPRATKAKTTKAARTSKGAHRAPRTSAREPATDDE